jgi:hypothetical protein
MSLARTALRLSTVLLLSNNATEPYPTIAKENVFDSRIDPRQLFKDRERKPLIVVYTDRDQGDPRSRNDKTPNLHRIVDLIIEISVTASAPDEEGTYYGPVATDSEVEASLDHLEDQVRRTLLHGTGPWAKLWRKVTIKVLSFDSDRFVEPDDGNVRYAVRRIAVEVEIKDDCVVRPHVQFDGDTVTPDAVMPAPLQAVVDALDQQGATSSHVSQVVAVVEGGGLPVPDSVPALERVRFYESEHRETNNEDVQKGPRPDGVAEVDFDHDD